MLTKENVSWYLLYPPDHYELQLALDNLKGYYKTLSIIYLRIIGYPILNGIIITSWDEKAKETIIDFCKKNHFKELLIRIDKVQETGSAPRGGYIIDYKNLEKEVTRYLREERIVILLEPKSPYNDLYSVNALYAEDREDIVLEIVGPGFDASDLNRGDISPHQILSIPKTFLKNFHDIDRFLKQLYIVSPTEYKQSVEQRLIKIGMSYALRNELNISKWSNKKIIQLSKKYLQESGYTLLLKNLERYTPIHRRHLQILLPYITELPIKLKELRIRNEPTMVLSSSILNENDGRLNFWDILWPSLKYIASQRIRNNLNISQKVI